MLIKSETIHLEYSWNSSFQYSLGKFKLMINILKLEFDLSYNQPFWNIYSWRRRGGCNLLIQRNHLLLGTSLLLLCKNKLWRYVLMVENGWHLNFILNRLVACYVWMCLIWSSSTYDFLRMSWSILFKGLHWYGNKGFRAWTNFQNFILEWR